MRMVVVMLLFTCKRSFFLPRLKVVFGFSLWIGSPSLSSFPILGFPLPIPIPPIQFGC